MTHPHEAPFDALPDFLKGSVWLAGAGPGDPAHLTLLALHGLRHADIVLHDRLVDQRVLLFAAPHTQLVCVGKRPGEPGQNSQKSLTQKLISHARAGLRVLRLKGGDPCVFARGAEEALELAQAGIPFRFVPGVTAGLGGLALAGIPATARDTNHAVILVTGHAAGAPDDPVDWDWLAGLRGASIIVYMGLARLSYITAALLNANMPPNTPAAVIERASLPQMRSVIATLADLHDRVNSHRLESPAMIVVGDVVLHAHRLSQILQNAGASDPWSVVA